MSNNSFSTHGSLDNKSLASMAIGHQCAKLVSQYATNIWSRSPSFSPRNHLFHRDTAINRLWHRARHWLSTVSRLDQITDIQAFSVAFRTMLELAVDMMLIARDTSDDSGCRYFMWAESDRIKHFESVVNHFAQLRETLPDMYLDLLEQHQKDKSLIDPIRVRLWPHPSDPTKSRVPDRWTGRNLFDDLVSLDRTADEQFIINECVGIPLAALYRQEIKLMQWNVHAGLAGAWNSDDPSVLYFMNGTALNRCADIGMMSTFVLLNQHASKAEVAQYYGEFHAIKRQRSEIIRKAEVQFGVTFT